MFEEKSLFNNVLKYVINNISNKVINIIYDHIIIILEILLYEILF